MFKLGTMVTDRITGLLGMLTHVQVEDSQFMYLFQPHGLNPKTGEPVEEIWIGPSRVTNGVEIETPKALTDGLAVLGTEVEDEASGFKGTAIVAILHINGCVHIDIQPPGVVEETGKPVKRHNFDIRRLKGEAIKPLTEAQYEHSLAATPSPASFTPWTPGD